MCLSSVQVAISRTMATSADNTISDTVSEVEIELEVGYAFHVQIESSYKFI